jgi:hypothetical protein
VSAANASSACTLVAWVRAPTALPTAFESFQGGFAKIGLMTALEGLPDDFRDLLILSPTPGSSS